MSQLLDLLQFGVCSLSDGNAATARSNRFHFHKRFRLRWSSRQCDVSRCVEFSTFWLDTLCRTLWLVNAVFQVQEKVDLEDFLKIVTWWIHGKTTHTHTPHLMAMQGPAESSKMLKDTHTHTQHIEKWCRLSFFNMFSLLEVSVAFAKFWIEMIMLAVVFVWRSSPVARQGQQAMRWTNTMVFLEELSKLHNIYPKNYAATCSNYRFYQFYLIMVHSIWH